MNDEHISKMRELAKDLEAADNINRHQIQKQKNKRIVRPRKPSLPQNPVIVTDIKAEVTSKHKQRQSLFFNERRSSSVSNIAQTTKVRSHSRPMIQNIDFKIPKKIKEVKSENANRKQISAEDYVTNSIEKNQCLISQSSLIEQLEVIPSSPLDINDKDNTEDQFFNKLEDGITVSAEVSDLTLVEVRKPVNSILINKMKYKRRSNLSEKNYVQHSYEDKNIERLLSAPESSRNSTHNQSALDYDDESSNNTNAVTNKASDIQPDRIGSGSNSEARSNHLIVSELPSVYQTSTDSGISGVTMATNAQFSLVSSSSPTNNASAITIRKRSMVNEIDSDNKDSCGTVAKGDIQGNDKEGVIRDSTLSANSFSDDSCTMMHVMSIPDKLDEGNYWKDYEPRDDDTLKANNIPVKLEASKKFQTIRSTEDQNDFFRKMSRNISETSSLKKEIIRFNIRDGTTTIQIIDKSQTCSDVIKNLKQKYNLPPSTLCQLIEYIHHESIERILEDHENILEIFYSWNSDSFINKFIFQKNPAAYIIFTQPNLFYAEMASNFELSDILWIKESRKKWRKAHCFILDACIYFNSKIGSKDNNDLSCLVQLRYNDFYTCTDSNRIKKIIKAPTKDVILFKSDKKQHDVSIQTFIGTINNGQFEKWIHALRVSKFGIGQLKRNYLSQDESGIVSVYRSANNSLSISPDKNTVF